MGVFFGAHFWGKKRVFRLLAPPKQFLMNHIISIAEFNHVTKHLIMCLLLTSLPEFSEHSPS